MMKRAAMNRHLVTCFLLLFGVCPLLIAQGADVRIPQRLSSGANEAALTADWFPITAGPFTYGEFDEPRMIDYDYAVMKCPVTNAQYLQYLQEALVAGTITISGDSVFGTYPGDANWPAGTYLMYLLGDRTEGIYHFGGINYSGSTFQVVPNSSYANHPAVNVSWFGAWAFAQHYNLRLPTEQEWEKAARGNTGYSYPWGNSISSGDANYDGSGDPFSEGTTPVGYYNGSQYGGFQTNNRPSPYGAYDMAGNAWGWTDNFYGGSLPTDRVVRGGAWDNTTDLLRSWNRGALPPTTGYRGVGFRCVLGNPLSPAIDSLTGMNGYDGAVPLTWKRPVGNILSYNVYRANSTGGPYQQIAGRLTRSWYRDESVVDGTTYYYVVTAVDDNGESAFSEERAGQSRAGGYRVQTGWATAAPTLDGVLSPGEWSAASPVIITYPGSADTVKMFIMNNQTQIYIAVDDQKTQSLPPGGGIGLFFDTNHDRFWTGGTEGYLQWNWDGGTSSVLKRFSAYSGVWPDSITSSSAIDPANVVTGLSNSAGHLQYEASVAISGALFPIVPGDEFGIFVYAIDFNSGEFTAAWPQENVTKLRPFFGDAGYRWAHGPFSFGDIRLATAQAVPPMALAATNATTTTFVANWSAVSGATGYRLDVATDVSFTAVVSGYNNVDVGNVTSSSVTGLTPNTTYYYRVRSVGPGGTSGNSNVITVATQPTAPGVPTALAASNATITGFTANWSAVAGATGYRLDVATDAGFSAYVSGYSDNDVGNVTSHPVTGLNAGTTYHYRVRAVSGGGTSANSNIITVATVPATVAAPVVGQPKSIEADGFTATWEAVAGATNYQLDVSADSFLTFVSGYERLSVGNTLRSLVTGLAPETQYFYRVYAEVGGNAGPPSDAVSLITYATEYTVFHSVSYPSATSLTDYTQADYRLVGLPGADGWDIGTFLWGVWKENWQLYWDNGKPGSPQDYYVEYVQGRADFSTTAGKAFWILNLGDLTLSGTVATAPLDTNNEATILLTPGQKWNLITNPFDKKISWTAVAAYNNIASAALRAWMSGWVNVTEMSPYEGYLFANDSNKTSLKVPYRLTMPGVAPVALARRAGWSVDLIARSGKFQDRTTTFGIVSDAEIGLDDYEQAKPRHFAGVPDVYFDQVDWNPDYREFATDMRPAGGELEVWDICVRSEGKTKVELEFTGVSDVPQDLAVVLADPVAGRSQDLRKERFYTVDPATAITVVHVLVGAHEKVSKEAAKVTTQEYVLEQNYPNPFNPTTRIDFTVAGVGSGWVRLAVYDLLGRELKVLLNEKREPGRYEVTFDGAGFSSGMYMYRLQTEGVVKTRKMTLVR